MVLLYLYNSYPLGFRYLVFRLNHVKKSQSFTGRGSVINLAGPSPAFYTLKIIIFAYRVVSRIQQSSIVNSYIAGEVA